MVAGDGCPNRRQNLHGETRRHPFAVKMQEKIIEIDETEEDLTASELQKIIKQGLTKHDKENPAVRITLRLPTWLSDLLKEIATRSGISTNKATLLAIKKGLIELQRIEKGYNTALMRRLLKQIAYILHDIEGDLILSAIAKKGNWISNGRKAEKSTSLIWWTHGLLTKLSEDLEITLNDLVIVSLTLAVLDTKVISNRLKKEGVRIIEQFTAQLELQHIIANAVIEFLPTLERRSIQRDGRIKKELEARYREMKLHYDPEFSEIFRGHQSATRGG